MWKAKSRLLVLALLLLMPLWACGEDNVVLNRLVFRSGRVVVGEIVLRNDEVVIVKDSYGSRFQYPLSDIAEITELKDDEPEVAQDDKKSRSVTNVKRTSLGARVAGGVASLGDALGGAIAADFRIGANNLGGRHIFLGGQVGYRALMLEGKTLSILPIDVSLELPLTQGEHVPMLGASVGYGIGLAGVKGGLNGGLSLAYRYHFSRTGAFHIGLEAEVQQVSAAHSIEIEPEQAFVSSEARAAVMGMLTVGVLF